MEQKSISVENLQLGMKQGPGGDYFEHDIAELAEVVKKKHPDRRVCFDYDLSRIKSEDGIRHPAIVVEGVEG